jgi:hypothetical protein
MSVFTSVRGRGRGRGVATTPPSTELPSDPSSASSGGGRTRGLGPPVRGSSSSLTSTTGGSNGSNSSNGSGGSGGRGRGRAGGGHDNTASRPHAPPSGTTTGSPSSASPLRTSLPPSSSSSSTTVGVSVAATSTTTSGNNSNNSSSSSSGESSTSANVLADLEVWPHNSSLWIAHMRQISSSKLHWQTKNEEVKGCRVLIQQSTRMVGPVCHHFSYLT